jgi:hypothetical protein
VSDRLTTNLFAATGKHLMVHNGVQFARDAATPSKPDRADGFVRRTAIRTCDTANSNRNIAAKLR